VHCGHVATDPHGRQTRGAFLPNRDFAACYDAVVLPALLLHGLNGDAPRLAKAHAIAARLGRADPDPDLNPNSGPDPNPDPNPNQARAIASMWLKPGGAVLPPPAAVRAEPVRYALGRSSWFGAVSEDKQLWPVGFWGALMALNLHRGKQAVMSPLDIAPRHSPSP